MLKQRVLTAVVLITILVGAMLLPSSWPLNVLLSVAAACALWEWLRLSWPEQASFFAPTVAVLMFCLMLAMLNGWQVTTYAPWVATLLPLVFKVLLPLVVLVWVVGVSLMLAFAQVQTPQTRVALSLFGVAAVFLAWASLVQMVLAQGPAYLVSMMAIVWVADVAAYFAGRALGKRKLAPRISPGKTWAGLVGGVMGVVAYVLLSAQWEQSYAAHLLQHWSWPIAVLIAVLLAVLSVMGDLFESLLKRRAGVKDSSQLLPGHGGVYDRIDALIPVAPVALLVGGNFGAYFG